MFEDEEDDEGAEKELKTKTMATAVVAILIHFLPANECLIEGIVKQNNKTAKTRQSMEITLESAINAPRSSSMPRIIWKIPFDGFVFSLQFVQMVAPIFIGVPHHSQKL